MQLTTCWCLPCQIWPLPHVDNYLSSHGHTEDISECESLLQEYDPDDPRQCDMSRILSSDWRVDFDFLWKILFLLGEWCFQNFSLSFYSQSFRLNQIVSRLIVIALRFLICHQTDAPEVKVNQQTGRLNQSVWMNQLYRVSHDPSRSPRKIRRWIFGQLS